MSRKPVSRSRSVNNAAALLRTKSRRAHQAARVHSILKARTVRSVSPSASV
jgi:hypothetical protein